MLNKNNLISLLTLLKGLDTAGSYTVATGQAAAAPGARGREASLASSQSVGAHRPPDSYRVGGSLVSPRNSH